MTIWKLPPRQRGDALAKLLLAADNEGGVEALKSLVTELYGPVNTVTRPWAEAPSTTAMFSRKLLDDDSAVTEQATLALGRIATVYSQDDGIARVLEPMLKHSSAKARRAAVEGVAQRGGSDAWKCLAPCADDGDAMVRAEFFRQVGRASFDGSQFPDEVADAIREGAERHLTDRALAVRVNAAGALRWIGDAKSMKALEQAKKKTKIAEERGVLELALKELKSRLGHSSTTAPPSARRPTPVLP